MPNDNQLPILRELLELDRDTKPHLAKIEKLKKQVREFGAGDYEVDDLGVVKVSEPSVARVKGTELRLDLEKWSELPAPYQADLIEQGVVKTAVIMTQARASSVSCQLS